MKIRAIDLIELRECLLRNGHSIWEEDPKKVLSTEVSPPRDVITTVALNLDPTLMPTYRERYFACLVGRDHHPILEGEPAFALSGLYMAISKLDHPVGDFMMGPFRWLLRRLARFSQVILWPGMKYRAANGVGFVDTWLLEESPQLQRFLQEIISAPLSIGAIVLDLAIEKDCRVLWEAGNLVSKGYQDFFVADLEGAEVYECHTHDKVVISIPSEPKRLQLLSELAGLSNFMEDCSRYLLVGDDSDPEMNNESEC